MASATTLRGATVGDAGAIQAIYAPIVRDTPISFELDVPDTDEMARRIAATLERFPYIVALHGTRVVGYAYAGAFKERAAYRFAAEVTVYVDDAARGQGVGRMLYETLLYRLRADGYRTAIGIIALPNAGSVALHEAVGFRHAGTVREVGFKFDRWHDIGWWQVRL